MKTLSGILALVMFLSTSVQSTSAYAADSCAENDRLEAAFDAIIKKGYPLKRNAHKQITPHSLEIFWFDTLAALEIAAMVGGAPVALHAGDKLVGMAKDHPERIKYIKRFKWGAGAIYVGAMLGVATLVVAGFSGTGDKNTEQKDFLNIEKFVLMPPEKRCVFLHTDLHINSHPDMNKHVQAILVFYETMAKELPSYPELQKARKKR